MADQIKAGDVVMLRSGGPDMTVTAVGDQYGTPTAWCSWFDGKKQCNATFSVAALALSDSAPIL